MYVRAHVRVYAVCVCGVYVRAYGVCMLAVCVCEWHAAWHMLR